MQLEAVADLLPAAVLSKVSLPQLGLAIPPHRQHCLGAGAKGAQRGGYGLHGEGSRAAQAFKGAAHTRWPGVTATQQASSSGEAEPPSLPVQRSRWPLPQTRARTLWPAGAAGLSLVSSHLRAGGRALPRARPCHCCCHSCCCCCRRQCCRWPPAPQCCLRQQRRQRRRGPAGSAAAGSPLPPAVQRGATGPAQLWGQQPIIEGRYPENSHHNPPNACS